MFVFKTDIVADIFKNSVVAYLTSCMSNFIELELFSSKFYLMNNSIIIHFSNYKLFIFKIVSSVILIIVNKYSNDPYNCFNNNSCLLKWKRFIWNVFISKFLFCFIHKLSDNIYQLLNVV